MNMIARRTLLRLANWIMGRAHFRVRYSYKNSRGLELFSITMTISLYDRAEINNHRAIKQAGANPYYLYPDARRVLCNGTLEMEPVCYLGRWHLQSGTQKP